jgi:hypothetical protein
MITHKGVRAPEGYTEIPREAFRVAIEAEPDAVFYSYVGRNGLRDATSNIPAGVIGGGAMVAANGLALRCFP